MTRVIGKLTTTPDVGDPIVSPWYQQIATYARHIFASKSELDAQWADAPNGAVAYTTDTGTVYNRVAGAWVGGWITTFVPQLYNGAQPVTATVAYCTFQNINGLVTYQGQFNVTGTGAVANIQWNMPRTCPYPASSLIGVAQFYDASAGSLSGALCEFNGTSVLTVRNPGSSSVINTALGPSDGVMWSVQYRTTQVG